MLGILVNTGTIFLGGILGLFMHKRVSNKVGDRIMEGFGLFVIIIGVAGAIQGNQYILYLASIVVGALIGEGLKLDQRLEKFADFTKKKLAGKGDNPRFTEGFITSAILFCVGSMAIIGPFQAVLEGNNTLLFVKASLDGVTAFILAASCGGGVFLSGILVLVYQGLITLLAFFLKDFLSEATINAVSVLGSLLVMGIGLNMLKATKIKIVNLIPVMFIPMLYQPISYLINWLRGVFNF